MYRLCPTLVAGVLGPKDSIMAILMYRVLGPKASIMAISMYRLCPTLAGVLGPKASIMAMSMYRLCPTLVAGVLGPKASIMAISMYRLCLTLVAGHLNPGVLGAGLGHPAGDGLDRAPRDPAGLALDRGAFPMGGRSEQTQHSEASKKSASGLCYHSEPSG